MEPANPSLHSVWYTTTSYQVDYNMSYPSPAPSDPSPVPRAHNALDPYPEYSQSQLSPSSGPDRQRRPQSDIYALPAQSYAPYESSRHRSSPRPSSVVDSQRVPSPSLSTVSSTSSHRGPHHSVSPGAPSSRPLPPPPQRREQHKHTKHRLRNIDRKNICLYQIDHPHARQEDIGAEFNVERSTISKILKDRHRWLNTTDDELNSDQTAKHRPSKFPEIEEDMRKSLQQWTDENKNITDNLIRTRALEIAAAHYITPDRFKGSSGWVENFKSRHEIRRGEWLQAVRYGPTVRGARPDINNVMGVGYDEHGNPNTHEYRETQQLPHPMQLPLDHPSHPSNAWRSQVAATVAAADAVRAQKQAAAHAAAQAQHAAASSSTSSSSSTEIHTPLQSQLPLDSSAIQHSPDGYDGNASQPPNGAEYIRASQQQLAVQYGQRELPSLEEAEDAMNMVLEFVDRVAPQGFLSAQERVALTHVKCAMFNLANGMPYDRV